MRGNNSTNCTACPMWAQGAVKQGLLRFETGGRTRRASLVSVFCLFYVVLFLCSAKGTEMVQISALRRTLASCPLSKCASYLNFFDTVGWVAGKASDL